MKPHSTMIGFAAAMLLSFAAAPAHAFCNTTSPTPPFKAKCQATTATKVDHIGTDKSECFAQSDGTGKATACAAGDHSSADSEMSTKGKTLATARGGSFSEAIADNGGDSTSHVGGASDGDATSDDNGVALTNAHGKSEAHTQAFGKCHATAKATKGSFAQARCEHDNTHATATADKGGVAKAFDDAPPTCTANGGTAEVQSSDGNCHAP